jgi:hypothetical protein
VLDVGTASGFLSFEAEKRGAIVTGFDADDVSWYQHVPSKNKPDHSGGFPMMRRGYWLAHVAHKSNTKVIYGDIYQLSEQVPAHDVVLIGQILVHLRDPLEARFLGSEQNWYSWWHISDELYRRWFALLGFEMVGVTQNKFICTLMTDPAEVWTFVARGARHRLAGIAIRGLGAPTIGEGYKVLSLACPGRRPLTATG